MHFTILLESHEKCMISIFSYKKIVGLAFLVNPVDYPIDYLLTDPKWLQGFNFFANDHSIDYLITISKLL